MRALLLLLGLSLPLCSAAAQIYHYTDEQGNRVFTDSPPISVDAERLDLPRVNSVPRTLPPKDKTQSSIEDEAAPLYSQLTLQVPDEEAIRANNGSFTVTVSITPALAAQHRLQLLVDGQPHGMPSSSLQLSAANLDRGEHALAVQVLSGKRLIQQSADVAVVVQRIHLNSPARRSAR